MDLKHVNIKGKEYVMVNERIRAFRSLPQFKDWRLVTNILERTDQHVLMEAVVMNADGNAVANGHALEEKASSYINKTSYIENCETSAIGRALGCLGIGVDKAVASAEEIQFAIKQQSQPRAYDKTKSRYFYLLKEFYGEESIPVKDIEDAKTMSEIDMQKSIKELEIELSSRGE